MTTETTTQDTGAAPTIGVATAGDKTATTTTIVDDGLLGAGQDPAARAAAAERAPPSWPDDWRSKMAGGDADLAKRLERFTDPAKVVTSWRAAEQKISSGEYRRPLPENATDQQISEWRTANGIPETADKYDTTVEGVEWRDEAKPHLDLLRSKMHAINADPRAVKVALEVAAEVGALEQRQTIERDYGYRQENEDVLRSEWGQDFRPNVNLYKQYLEDPKVGPEPGTTWGSILGNARDANGNKLLNNRIVAQWFVDNALATYGRGAMTYGDAPSAGTYATREAEIMKIMKSDYARYEKEGLSKELYEIRAKMKGE